MRAGRCHKWSPSLLGARRGAFEKNLLQSANGGGGGIGQVQDPDSPILSREALGDAPCACVVRTRAPHDYGEQFRNDPHDEA